ncbi:cupin domain-containing protein [Nakamurella lactea]|uniref:cupin domain-containing protein n=1 Tax=Nakamurella lactea TaxID=459515 RepID=UPI00041DEA0D|nr:cupin domain-containing protein [Nakamurella lactea]
MSTADFPPVILRPESLAAHDRGGGVRTIPLVRRAVGAQTFLNGITIFDPGAALPLHLHSCAESVTILAGDAIADIDGVCTELGSWDTTLVAAGTPHRFRNASAIAPMRILWTYGSIDATRTIIGSGITSRIDAEGAGGSSDPAPPA